MPGPFSFWPLAIAALSVTACASVAAPTEPSPDSTPDASTATHAGEGGAAPAPASTDAPADSAAPAASAAPTASGSAAPSVSASASAAPAASVAALLEMSEPKFTSGEVPKAQAALEKLSKKLKTCIDEGGGLQTVPGSLEIQFLVRAAGVAEGVDIVKSKGVSDAAKKCIVSALQKKTIGTPSSDPVGVTVTFKLTAAK